MQNVSSSYFDAASLTGALLAVGMRKCLPVAFLCLLGCERPPNPLAISQAFPVPSLRGSGWSSLSTSHRSRPWTSRRGLAGSMSRDIEW